MRALPSLRQLRYLVAIAEHRHFGRAAEACFATQPTLSAGLKELEQLLGVRLVERDRQSVAMTPADEAAPTGRRLLAQLLDFQVAIPAAEGLSQEQIDTALKLERASWRRL